MNIRFTSFDHSMHVAVIGLGGIGRALCTHLAESENVARLTAFSRARPEDLPARAQFQTLDVLDQSSLSAAAENLEKPLDLLIITTGMLHDETTGPEKSLKDIELENFQKIFAVNSFAQALVMKHFIPKMRTDRKAVFAALSARVGSISDNGLGGWYAYRASKAALNMLIKNTAIETGRRHKSLVIAGLHPGTVNTALSKPFQANVPPEKLFTPEFSAHKMLEVIDGLTPAHSGKIFAWDGQEILP
jgi:NAD(P)-dependent dehydrogenase (short-subunit alcohol dehydrogenase family)